MDVLKRCGLAFLRSDWRLKLPNRQWVQLFPFAMTAKRPVKDESYFTDYPFDPILPSLLAGVGIQERELGTQFVRKTRSSACCWCQNLPLVMANLSKSVDCRYGTENQNPIFEAVKIGMQRVRQPSVLNRPGTSEGLIREVPSIFDEEEPGATSTEVKSDHF